MTGAVSDLMNTTGNIAFYDLHTRIRDPIIFSLLDIKQGERILDVGSGTGYFAEKMIAYGVAPVCVDISVDNLLSIKQHQMNHLFLINAHAEKLPLRNDSFDKILCSEVLEHIDDERQALRELVRALRPGGLLVITVPCTESKFPSLIECLGIKTVHDYDGPEKHYRKGYTLAELSSVLGNAGMSISRSVYFSHFFSKLLLDVISLLHLFLRKFVMRQCAWNWADIQQLNSSVFFSIYKVFFPFLLMVSKLDKYLLSSKSQGCGLAVCSKKQA